MKKGRKPTHVKKNLLHLVPLLVIFILIKLGQIPILIVKQVIRLRFPKIHSPMFHFPSPPHRGRPPKRRIPHKIKIAFLVALATTIFFSYTLFTIQATRSLPSPKRLLSVDAPLTTEFYDRNGRLLYRMYEGRNRSLVNLQDLPQHLIQATIAIEDKNFYSHPGFDLQAILRAAVSNFKTKELQGASTITQQLVKNSLLAPEKTYVRKIKEIFLAFWAERIFSKDEILQMYFNEAPYGGPAWGIEAAAETYFGKSARDLNLAQSSYLSGLPASPTEFSPYGSSTELTKARQRQVLGRMVEDQYLTPQEADQAFSEELTIRPPANQIKAPHFVMYLRDLLSQKYGLRVISQGGLKISTTLDLDIQEKVEEIIRQEITSLSHLNVRNGAAMVTNVKTGQILAMVGSKDYHEPNFGNFNVTTSLRQPGSSIKVVTYATAFKKGFSPGNTVLDTPVAFKDGVRNYSPVNYDGKYHGPVSIRVALGSSYNVPAVKMLATVGMEDMIKTASDLGITTFIHPQNYGLSLTLGGGEVRMIDMISVYGSLANFGYKKYPTPILKIVDSKGNILEEYEEKQDLVLEPEIAYLITDILRDNKARSPAFGPNSLLQIPGFEVAAKTGTSDNKRDNWTFGYTPRYVVGVWVGNNDNTPMNQSLTSGITGAAPIWNKIMHTLLDGTESLVFERPPGIVEGIIDGRKDLVWSQKIPKSLVRVLKSGEKLTFSDTFTVYATSSASLGQ